MRKFSRILGIFIFLNFVFLSLGLSQEQLTITTYYPSPVGSYRDLQSQTLRYTPATRTDVETRFHCTVDATGTAWPDANPAACAGLTYFDSNDNMVYYFDGTSWSEIGGGEAAGGGSTWTSIGGYKNIPYTTTAAEAIGASLEILMPTDIEPFNNSAVAPTGKKSVDQLYTALKDNAKRVTQWSKRPEGIVIDFENFPKGTYQIRYGAKIDIDEYVRITGINISYVRKISSGGSSGTISNTSYDLKTVNDTTTGGNATEGDWFEDLVDEANQYLRAKYSPRTVTMYLHVWGCCKDGNYYWKLQDKTEPLADSMPSEFSYPSSAVPPIIAPGFDGEAHQWADAGVDADGNLETIGYTHYDIERIWPLVQIKPFIKMGIASNNPDNRYFRLYIKRDGTYSGTWKIKGRKYTGTDPLNGQDLGTGEYFKATIKIFYEMPVYVRVSDRFLEAGFYQ